MKKKVIIATILIVITIGICVFFQRENKEKDVSTSVLLRYEDIGQSMTSVMPVTLSYGFDGIIFVKNISPATLLYE